MSRYPLKKRKSKRTLKKARSFNQKHFLILSIYKIRLVIIWASWRLAFILLAVVVTTTAYFYAIIPPFENILDGRSKGSVTLMDRNGKTFAWRGEQLDSSLRSTNTGKYLVNAIIAAEDKRFFHHFGISLRGITGAILINLREGRHPLKGHGGSTITQQVAKLLCLMQKMRAEIECRRQTLARKILEVPFSFALELKFTKHEILSIYMNRVYLGASSIGFESASQRYFGKTASETSLQESAMLAALLTAPSRYAPTQNLLIAQKRANLIIDQMLEQKFITNAEAEKARKLPAVLAKGAKAALGTYFADWVMLEAPNYLTLSTTEDIVINTTFDRKVQNHVEKSVASIFKRKVKAESKAEVAVVVMEMDGSVLAMLGGRGKTQLPGQYNRAFQAYRQPGSAFKPFVYAAALEDGYLPKHRLVDTESPPQNLRGLNYWPKNHDNKYLGAVDLTTGLSQSINTATVQLAYNVGLQKIIKVARGLGVKTEMERNLSLALGSSEVSLLDLTTAYAGFLNLGKPVHSKGWIDLRLRYTNEILINSTSQIHSNVIGEFTSKAIILMLKKAVLNGTGQKAQVADWQIAGKTGTTQDSRDAWFVGFTSRYIVGVWVGNDDNSPLEGVVGGNLPAEIFSEIMRRIHMRKPARLPDLLLSEYEHSFGSAPARVKTEKLETKSGVLSTIIDFLRSAE